VSATCLNPARTVDDVVDRSAIEWTEATWEVPERRAASGPIGEVDLDGIHWVLAGGESGVDARPVEYEWVADRRDT
jgi:protein gp37